MNEYISNSADSNSVKYLPTLIPVINHLIDSNQLNGDEISRLDGLDINQQIYLYRTSRYLDRIAGAYYELISIEHRRKFQEAIPILESLGGVFKSELADFIIELAENGNKLSREIFYVGSLYYSFIGDPKGEFLKQKLAKHESKR